MTKTRGLQLVVVTMALAAAACSDASRLSPVGPSALPAAPAASLTPTAAADWATAHGWSAMADGRVAVADGVQVEAVEAIGGVSGACPSRTITLRGVAVTVTPSTVFASPLTCAALAAGTTVRVTGVLLPSGNGYAVTATNLAPVEAAAAPVVAPAPTPGSGRRSERLTGEGVVGAVNGECPAVSFVILGYRVQATAATQFSGGRCEALREGAQVRLEVEQEADGRILAQSIELLRVPGSQD